MLKTVIVIPARKGSTRFPSKPMAPIRGKNGSITLLERTWRIAKAVQNVDGVFIATDDAEIESFAKKFGANVIMTRPECRNGSERVFDALKKMPERPEILVNLQGDAVLTPPWVIQAAVDAIQKDPSIRIATPTTEMNEKQFADFKASKSDGRVSGTMVVFDKNFNALYFSKGIIPFVRNAASKPPLYRHIGLYAYRVDALEKYVSLEPSSLEQTEGLEQLRALENAIPIRVIPVDYRGRTHWSIDNPEDIKIVEEIIAREGELVE